MKKKKSDYLENDKFVLESVNNGPRIEYRYRKNKNIIESRKLKPDGTKFEDGSSEWEEVSVYELYRLTRLKIKLSKWIRHKNKIFDD